MVSLESLNFSLINRLLSDPEQSLLACVLLSTPVADFDDVLHLLSFDFLVQFPFLDHVVELMPAPETSAGDRYV